MILSTIHFGLFISLYEKLNRRPDANGRCLVAFSLHTLTHTTVMICIQKTNMNHMKHHTVFIVQPFFRPVFCFLFAFLFFSSIHFNEMCCCHHFSAVSVSLFFLVGICENNCSSEKSVFHLFVWVFLFLFRLLFASKYFMVLRHISTEVDATIFILKRVGKVPVNAHTHTSTQTNVHTYTHTNAR